MNDEEHSSRISAIAKDGGESQPCVERNAEEPPSLISLFFDQLNFKGLLKNIFKKTPIKVTDQFIDAMLLFLFLFYAYC